MYERQQDEYNRQFQNLYNNQQDIRRQFAKLDQMRTSLLRCMPQTALSFELALAEHCNLNCCGCDHFSPLAEPEFANFEKIKKDFERLAELFGRRVASLMLLGGEPLLHPEITKILHMTRNTFPETLLDIVTNGVLLQSMSEDFWTACHDKNIFIRVTKYPISLDFDDIEKLATSHHVKLSYFNDANKVKTLFKLKLDLQGLQNDRLMFISCHRANKCIYLQDGCLYTCTVAPTVRHFDKRFGTHLANVEDNSIDIYKASSAEEILSFLAKPIPFCKHCRIDKTEGGIPWHRSKKTMDEWT